MGGPAPGGAFSESWLTGAPVGPGRTDPPLDPSDEGGGLGGDASPVASWRRGPGPAGRRSESSTCTCRTCRNRQGLGPVGISAQWAAGRPRKSSGRMARLRPARLGYGPSRWVRMWLAPPGGTFSESWLTGAPVGPGRTDPPQDPSDEGGGLDGAEIRRIRPAADTGGGGSRPSDTRCDASNRVSKQWCCYKWLCYL